MPGHKGLFGHPHDITEIDGADVLYSPSGIIKESETYAAELFGTARTVYSAEGSSLSIKAMLALTVTYARECGERPLILAARNAHKTFVNAAALLDFDVEWIWGDSLIHCPVNASVLEDAIKRLGRKPTALYVTSPDYLGNICDIRSLADACHERGILLLVDNAHGAYLRFLPEDIHPITLGADLSCDSAHKTLPAITGAGYLHVSKNAPSIFAERADEAMALFASTSPSYLILESLDAANAYLSDGFGEKLGLFKERLDGMKKRLEAAGFTLVGDEALKLTLRAKNCGYLGTELSSYLEERGFVSEFSDPDFLTLMFSPEFGQEELSALENAFLSLQRKSPIKSEPPTPPRAVSAMRPRDAVLAPSLTVDVKESVGRVLASASVSCPPAVPILMSGEIITKEACECFEYYRTEKIRVVK